MRILITNDDGIQAPGIRALARRLSEIAQITVVAPEMQRSAVGHGITLHKPLRLDEVEFGGDIAAYSSNGTPADCVTLGTQSDLPEPDFIAAGINAGANLGEEVLYSGTASAAMEGALHGFQSLALSVCSYVDVNYGVAEAIAPIIIEVLAEYPLHSGTFLNVNVPNVSAEDIQGVQVTRLGRRNYEEVLSKRRDPSGRPYYWLAGSPQEKDACEGTDIAAIQNNRISMTPIHFDVTSEDHWDGFEALRRRLEL